MSSLLGIELLGHFQLSYKNEVIPEFGSSRAQELLAYLLLHGHKPQPRQQIAYVLWPDSTDAQALTNLRQLLHHLRSVLPESDRFLAGNAKTLQWSPEAPFRLDIREFEEAIDCAEQLDNRAKKIEALETAAKLYQGQLLPTCYEEWLLAERERLHQKAIRALESLVDLLEEDAAYAKAIVHAQQLLHLDPLREATYQKLLQLHKQNGDRASALHVYHSCVTVFQRELGIEPGPALQEAHAELLETKKATVNQAPQTPVAKTLPLVGRATQWEQLLGAWQKASQTQAHLVVLSGEAGIGKTRLAEELLDYVARQELAFARTRSFAAEGQLAYAPVAELLRAEALRNSYPSEQVWLIELARLLPELLSHYPALPRPEPLTESWQRQRLFEALARAFTASHRPLLLLIDDLQWCDQDSLEWLHYLLRSNANAKILIVGTLRSEELEDNKPLGSILLDLQKLGQLATIALGPLDSDETGELAATITGKSLTAGQTEKLFEETAGNPLFVVETSRAGLLGDLLEGQDSAKEHRLPPKVQSVIKGRLAQVSIPQDLRKTLRFANF